MNNFTMQFVSFSILIEVSFILASSIQQASRLLAHSIIYKQNNQVPSVKRPSINLPPTNQTCAYHIHSLADEIFPYASKLQTTPKGAKSSNHSHKNARIIKQSVFLVLTSRPLLENNSFLTVPSDVVGSSNEKVVIESGHTQLAIPFDQGESIARN